VTGGSGTVEEIQKTMPVISGMWDILNKWTLGAIGAVLLGVATFYRYQFESRPLLEITAPNPIQTLWKDGTFKFDVPLRYHNTGASTAISVTTYHLFLTYPPGVVDQIETDVPDVAPKKEALFNLVKYIDTKTLTASTNFFKYQNMLIITTWRSDNLAHTGRLFSQAQWYRLYLSMNQNKLGSYLTLVKSKYYTLWGFGGEEKYHKIRTLFLKGETLQDAYNLKQLEWERGENKR